MQKAGNLDDIAGGVHANPGSRPHYQHKLLDCADLMQDFDKLEGILRDYKHFMSQCPNIDKTLPAHVHLSGFVEEGLQIHVHVSPDPIQWRQSRHVPISEKLLGCHACVSFNARFNGHIIVVC